MNAEHRAAMRLSGIAVSPGVAIGRAHCLYDIPVVHSTDPVDGTHILDELATLEDARQRTAHELGDLCEKVSRQFGDEEATIFRAHLSIVHDPVLVDRVRGLISERRLSASAALHSVAGEYEQLFSHVEDEYLRERLADVRDVLYRLSKNVTNLEKHFATPLDQPVVLVVNELLPSDVVALSEQQVLGIVTQSGGRTSHAAILARSYGIPSVAGVVDVLAQVASGDTLIVDGRAGHVFANPGRETLRVYGKAQSEFLQLKTMLATESPATAATGDGQPLELLANIGCPADAEQARKVGASGIGLYRTEFFFLTHPGIPREHEEIAAYRAVLDASPNGPVTIRTLDLGGDKTIPYLTHTHEANPFMGWRSIRLSFEHPELFLQQIRAVLRAAHDTDREVRLLFPMITAWDELQQVHGFVNRAREQLEAERIAQGSVSIGIMIEVPAAAVILEHLLDAVDFVSIGSNDLVQYLTAADRDNPKVSHLCQALSPAVLRVLHRVLGTCVEADKSVTVCGEMAGSLRAFVLLLAMGLRSFSMSPAFIPAIRDFASRITLRSAQSVLARALELRSSTEIHRLMDAYVEQVSPHLLPLLTGPCDGPQASMPE